jgi:hypothetical protein
MPIPKGWHADFNLRRGGFHVRTCLVGTVCWLIISAALPAAAAEPELTKPIQYTWIAQGCSTWSCALVLLAEADGNGQVIALPTRHPDYPWVILRRIVSGSIYIPPDEPFLAHRFDSIALAVAQFSAIPEDLLPMIVTAGNDTVVIHMRAAGRHRAVRR